MNKKLIFTSFISLVVLSLIDVTLTSWGVSKGLTELNPILTFFGYNPLVHLLIIGSWIMAMYFMLRVFFKVTENKKTYAGIPVAITFVFMNAFYAYVIINNAGLIL